jgi:hypothetical protein
MSATENAAFYAKGYAEGLRDSHEHDVARLIEERDIARVCLELERTLRLDAERGLADVQARNAAVRVELKTAISVGWIERFRTWNLNTFGPGKRTAGTLEHIRKECIEIEAAPDDPEEWVDIALLAINGLVRLGLEPASILARLTAKLDKNIARKWPDWRANPDGAIEHIREVA